MFDSQERPATADSGRIEGVRTGSARKKQPVDWKKFLQDHPELCSTKFSQEEELERIAREEEEQNAQLIRPRVCAARKLVKAPKYSLQQWARALDKTPQHVKRYCENGVIPGAFKTAGGHWRAPFTKKALNQVKLRLAGKTRRWGSTAQKKLRRAQEEPFPGELRLPSHAHKLTGDQYNALLAADYWTDKEKSRPPHPKKERLNLTNLARKMGIARSTLYRRRGLVDFAKQIIKSFVGNESERYRERLLPSAMRNQNGNKSEHRRDDADGDFFDMI